MTTFITLNAPLIVILALIVLAVVVVGCALEGYRVWTVHREKLAAALNAQAAEKAAQHAPRTERLEQRVQVLERIVTDRRIHLADEIEALRDGRALN